MNKKITAFLMAAAIMLLAAGCAGTGTAGGNVKIGSMKGPTSMGLLGMMDASEKGGTKNQYTFAMESSADALLPMILQGELDIALVPANVASILYAKTEGGVQVIDINTLGVLYMVSGQAAEGGLSSLKGKTIYLMGKGTTPDYVLQYLLEQNGLTPEDVTLEYKSEAAEVAALLAENPDAAGLLPQPYATAACMADERLKVILDLTKEWEEAGGSGSLVTGVTVVRKAFLESNEEAVKLFLEDHRESVQFAGDKPEETAALAAARGIVEKEAVALKALPLCNIVYIEKEEMKQALSGYLEALYLKNPESVGGALPDAGFYYGCGE